jgi:hypothetical protein
MSGKTAAGLWQSEQALALAHGVFNEQAFAFLGTLSRKAPRAYAILQRLTSMPRSVQSVSGISPLAGPLASPIEIIYNARILA